VPDEKKQAFTNVKADFMGFGEVEESVDAALVLASYGQLPHRLRLECERRILYRLRIIG
jgi:hypothetical protein